MFKKHATQQFSQKNTDMPDLIAKDEALFDALGKSKKARKKKIIRTVIVIVVLLAIILTVGVSFLRRKVREEFVTSKTEVITAQADRGTISTVVSGSGMLLNVDTEMISVPAGVEVTEILVEFGDTVTEGELLAVVDMASVRTAMSELQAQIEELDEQITDAEGDTVSSYIYAGVPGRVKIIYCEEGALVEDAMVKHGALAEISLDGYMAVDIEAESLAAGDLVTVVLSDGEEIDGTVKSVVGKNATILVTDNGPEYDEEVVVKTSNGEEIGSGKLYIHNPLKVTGYAGTISSVRVALNQKVYTSTMLFTLADTSSSASYDALLRSRSEIEETLLELLQIQRYGGMTAPISGSVYSVANINSEDEEEVTADIITLSPDVNMAVTISVDESDILSLKLGQEADVTVSSVTDEVLVGTVTEIDKTDSSGAYSAVVTVGKVEGMLSGMTASVDVRIDGVDNAILIPVDALHQTSTGYFVYTSYDEETQQFGGKVDVIPGISNSNYVEIKSGLNEGDTVYYSEAVKSFGNMGFGNMGGNMGGNIGGNRGGNGGGRPNGGQIPGERPSGRG